MIKKILIVTSILIMSSAYAFASTATYTPATAYTDNTAKESDDTFTTRIYEGSTLVCFSTAASCSFTSPDCGTGTHTYVGRTYSSKYNTESLDSTPATWTAPICSKTPVPPTILNITN